MFADYSIEQSNNETPKYIKNKETNNDLLDEIANDIITDSSYFLDEEKI